MGFCFQNVIDMIRGSNPTPVLSNNPHFFGPDFVSLIALLTAKGLSSTLYQQCVNTDDYEFS